jgi:hypothetical protein
MRGGGHGFRRTGRAPNHRKVAPTSVSGGDGGGGKTGGGGGHYLSRVNRVLAMATLPADTELSVYAATNDFGNSPHTLAATLDTEPLARS